MFQRTQHCMKEQPTSYEIGFIGSFRVGRKIKKIIIQHEGNTRHDPVGPVHVSSFRSEHSHARCIDLKTTRTGEPYKIYSGAQQVQQSNSSRTGKFSLKFICLHNRSNKATAIEKAGKFSLSQIYLHISIISFNCNS